MRFSKALPFLAALVSPPSAFSFASSAAALSSLPVVYLSLSSAFKALQTTPLLYAPHLDKKRSNLRDLKTGDLVFVKAPSSAAGKGTTAAASASDQQQQLQSVGVGVYNSHSLFAVRLLLPFSDSASLVSCPPSSSLSSSSLSSSSPSSSLLSSILSSRLSSASALRRSLLLPSPPTSLHPTSAYRLVNSDGDYLPGLTVDVFSPTLCVAVSSASWTELYRSEITQALEKHLQREAVDATTTTNQEHGGNNPYTVVWRRSEAKILQDSGGDKKEEAATDKKAGDAASTTADDRNQAAKAVAPETTNLPSVVAPPSSSSSSSSSSLPVSFLESGVKYEVDILASPQKSGFYADQRPNRLRLSQLSFNKRVLDLCCFSGGFGLGALLKGGARAVTFVDSSVEAVKLARRNAELNGITKDDRRATFVKMEAGKFCLERLNAASAKRQGRTIPMSAAFPQHDDDVDAADDGLFDVVVLDPPKLAPTAGGLSSARGKYLSLNSGALKLVDLHKGGLLFTFTCSQAMAERDGGNYFIRMVGDAAKAAGRHVTLLEKMGAGGDHTTLAEGGMQRYLLGGIFFVSPVVVATATAADAAAAAAATAAVFDNNGGSDATKAVPKSSPSPPPPPPYVRKVGVSSPSYLSSFVSSASARLIVVDVRNPDFALEPGDGKTCVLAPLPGRGGEEGYRPRAVNVPFDRIKNELDVGLIPKAWIEEGGGRENVPIITHCGGGGRGQKAKDFLEGRGFRNVVNGGGPEDEECWKVFGAK